MKEQVKALWTKHKWLIIGATAGLVIVIIVLIRNRNSSTSSTQNKNKTVTQSTAEQLDMDINNLETKLDNLGTSTVDNSWQQPTPSGLPQSPPTGSSTTNLQFMPPIHVKAGTGGSTELSEEWLNDEFHQQENTWSFRRFTDLFVPVNGTDHFDSVGARLN